MSNVFDLFGEFADPAPSKPQTKSSAPAQKKAAPVDDFFDNPFDDPKPAAKPAVKQQPQADEWDMFDAMMTGGGDKKAAAKPQSTPAKQPEPAVKRVTSSPTGLSSSSSSAAPQKGEAVSPKPELKKEDKCVVAGCKNKRLRRTYCAIHLNSELDTEKDLPNKTKKSPMDWSCVKSSQDPTSSRAYFSKNVITWKFTFKGESHTVVLRHSPVGGKRVILVNGIQVHTSKEPGGGKVDLSVGSNDNTRVPVSVVIKMGITTEYDLEIKGGSFDDARDIWLNSDDL